MRVLPVCTGFGHSLLKPYLKTYTNQTYYVRTIAASVQCLECAYLSAGSAEHVLASMQPPAAGVTYAVYCGCGVFRIILSMFQIVDTHLGDIIGE